MDPNFGSGILPAEDPFTLSALLNNFDVFSDLSSPLSSYGFSSANWAASTSLEFASSPSSGYFADSGEASNIFSSVPRSLRVASLAERMLKALSLFKASPDGGFLAQVWMPIKQGDEYVLSTSEQPYLLDQMMMGYREVSRGFTFSPKERLGAFPGLPGRVFISGIPEWTSNVGYYNRFEYLRVEHAIYHEVRGSLAVPVFDTQGKRCCAVLELVTTKEKPNFDVEMENVCKALQAVGLQSTSLQTPQQSLTVNQKSALTEILDVLRAVCHAHILPLALTWIPACYDSESMEEIRDAKTSVMRKTMLGIQESSCYVNDIRMQGFLHACAEHNLEKGQGPAGKALQSSQAFFSADVKGYDILEYPLAHHARKYGLQAAVAIRLRSTYTGDDDYVLEFFLPVNCKGGTEQQLLLDSLSSTMLRICKSLRRVLDDDVAKVDIHKGETSCPSTTDVSFKQSQGIEGDAGMADKVSFENQSTGSTGRRGGLHREQPKSRLSGHVEKKRNTLEKNISLTVLQQYFSGSLRDAAKNIGVCPTTLKRICRQHGISRWPSRKIKKVNRSLEKIQTVINSVHGVEGALKYDPVTGCLVTALASPEKPALIASDVVGRELTPKLVAKLERDDGFLDGNQIETLAEHSHPSSSSMTDSSSSSALSPPSIVKRSKDELCVAGGDSTITVKAVYKEDIVRFKLLPSLGFSQLCEEIGKRFKLLTGTFLLKYMDDEEEWVMLASESDLKECVDVLESMGSHSVKLLVRDVPCAIGSSGSSNCLLVEL